jgi:cytochrome c oxidase cbb3-type subunit 4
VSLHSTYDALRHFADSWGLVAMLVCFAGFAAWPFRRGARRSNERAAQMIFESDDHD